MDSFFGSLTVVHNFHLLTKVTEVMLSFRTQISCMHIMIVIVVVVVVVLATVETPNISFVWKVIVKKSRTAKTACRLMAICASVDPFFASFEGKCIPSVA